MGLCPCDLNGITHWGRLVAQYLITSPSAQVIMYPFTNPELCNAIQFTGQIRSCFYIMPLDINWSTNISIYIWFILSHKYLTACSWLCATMVALEFWIVCIHSGCTCCHLQVTLLKQWGWCRLLGFGGGWGCEVSCGGHHRLRGKTTTGSALDGAMFDIAEILAYLVHNMSRSQLYLGFGHFGWLPFFWSITVWRAYG